jgi:hypothetical protein
LDAYRVTVPNRNRGSFPESRCLRRPRRLRLAEADAAAVVEVVREEPRLARQTVPVRLQVPHQALLLVEARVEDAVPALQRAQHQALLRVPLLAVDRLGDAEVVRPEVAVEVEVEVLLPLVFPRRPYRSWIFFLLAESICQRGAV